MSTRPQNPWRAAAGLAFVAVLAMGSAAQASQHLPGEGASEKASEPRAAKIIMVDPADHIMLVGQRRSLWASICNADGTGCKDARKARWQVMPKKGLTLGAKKGAQSVVEGKRPGTYTLTVKQGKAEGTTTVTINEPPDRSGGSASSASEQRLYVQPEDATIGEGGVIRLVAWGCPLLDGSRLGPNEEPDGLDDGCTTVPIESVNIDPGAPLVRRALLGPTVVLEFQAFPADVPGDLIFLGAQLTTAIGGTLPSLQGARGPYDDPFFHDMNGDGLIDETDQAILEGGLPGEGEPPLGSTDPGFDGRLDLTGDRSLDADDAELFRLLANDVDVVDPEPEDVERSARIRQVEERLGADPARGRDPGRLQPRRHGHDQGCGSRIRDVPDRRLRPAPRPGRRRRRGRGRLGGTRGSDRGAWRRR